MMRRNKKLVIWVVIFSLIFSISSHGDMTLAAESKEIYIKNVEDLVTLAEKCALDTWSQGKKITMTADIDVSTIDFEGIPIFGGIFDGNGHTITGFHIKGNSSNQGFFRYISKDGMVKNLTVKGNIMPIGTKKSLGGIAGNNRGTIKNCTFMGMVEGRSYIGGIVGINEAEGQIIESSAVGTIYGEHYVGGIAGENLGTILKCKNKMNVNTTAGEAGSIVESIEQIDTKQILSTENAITTTDIGGIAGFSTGIIQGCQNNGTVGYQHIGYNVGGIVGRQTGYLSECQNNGEIYGRKDVGGIVGQMEPYISLEYSTDQVTHLQTELDKLQKLINQMISDAGGYSSEMSSEFSHAKEYIDSAIDTTHSIVNQTQSQYNDVVHSINNFSARISSTLEKLELIMSNAKVVGQEMNETLEQARKAVNSLNGISGEAQKALEQVNDTLDTAQENLNEYIAAVEQVNDAIDEMKEALGDEVAVKNAFDNLRKSLRDLNSSILKISNGMNEVLDGIDTLKECILLLKNINQLSEGYADLQGALGDVQQAVQIMRNIMTQTDSGQIREELKKCLSHIEDALKKWQSAQEKISEAIEEISKSPLKDMVIKSLDQFSNGLKNISKGLEEVSSVQKQIYTALEEIANQIDSEQMSLAVNKLEDASKELLQAAHHTSQGVDDSKRIISATQNIIEASDDTVNKVNDTIKALRNNTSSIEEIILQTDNLIQDLIDHPIITLPNLSSEYMNQTDQLSKALGDLSDVIGNMNQITKQHNNLILLDLQKINNQFFVVTNLLMDVAINKEELEDTVENYKEDISDADTESMTQGKVADSSNQGKVQGDINVGGITGSMAIEYDFDPEDDVSKTGNKSLKFQYLARAVIRKCTNKGDITSKKNYVGGIVGRMDLGTVIGSKGYGKIESNDGDYVGGIAGAAYSHIRDSYAMCTLLGNKNIGGIAGCAGKLTNNHAMVQIEKAQEYKGAIAGVVEELDIQKGNDFVNLGTHAIDDISYTGKAEPMSYEDFCKKQDVPDEFINLKLVFMAEGKKIAEKPFKFGEEIDLMQIPAVPKKVGYYGKWPDLDHKALTFSEIIEAEYTPCVSVLESNLTDNEKAIALVEGAFNDKTTLNVEQSNIELPREAHKEAKVWKVSILGEEKNALSVYELRLLAPEKGQVKVYQLQDDGKWKKVKTKTNGSYKIVKMVGETGIFCIDTSNYIKQIAEIMIIGIMLLMTMTGGRRWYKVRRKGEIKSEEIES